MDSVYWFMFLARPQPANPQYFHVPGAFVDAWVANCDMVLAEHMARNAIEGKKWRIERLERWAMVSPQTYYNSPQLRKHIEEARLFGESLAFYLWPAEEVKAP